jgi:hypothetical protein
MTTIIPFIPSNITTPVISVVLDNRDYNLVITWNIAAQRYYINIYDKISGRWVITVPLISSPLARAVENITYDPFLSVVKVIMADPPPWGPGYAAPGTMIDYTLEGFRPNIYNGTFRSLHINDTTFTFSLMPTPSPVTVVGRVSRLLNMAASVFNTSTLVYRNSCFEVNP